MRAKTEIINLTQLHVPRPPPFGEYLVQHGVIDRYQLFRVLQLQDRVPGTKLGACAVTLGYVPRDVIEEIYARFQQHPGGQDLETMVTETFHREPEIEIIYASNSGRMPAQG